jgi:hypothetical protein
MPPLPAETVAQNMMSTLGVDITIPTVDLGGEEFNIPPETGNPLYDNIAALTIDELTTGSVGGSGTFDKVMSSIKEHLAEQFQKNRISGDQYTKAYIEMTTAALSTGLQFLLQKDQSKWSAVLVQLQARKAEIEAVTARLALETAKAQLVAAQSQAEILEAQYVLIQLQVANEVAKYETTYAQKALVEEQLEGVRAQTRDTLSDGTTPVNGMVKKQKDLITQQIDSYIKDAKYKGVKLLSDSWIAQKTIDEGLTAPTVFTNTKIQEGVNEVLTDLGVLAP